MAIGLSALFVDTSAIFAGIAAQDSRHEQAVEIWSRLLDRDEPLLTHSMVELETVVLLQSRLGVEAVRAFAERLLPVLTVVEADREQRRAGLAELIGDRRRAIGLVDRVSFAVMRRLGITRAFAFDRHFADAGFDLIGPEAA